MHCVTIFALRQESWADRASVTTRLSHAFECILIELLENPVDSNDIFQRNIDGDDLNPPSQCFVDTFCNLTTRNHQRDAKGAPVFFVLHLIDVTQCQQLTARVA
jgi:hypothetical protein